MSARVEHLAEGVTLHLGDYRDILPSLESVTELVTSPPYADRRDYGQRISDWRSLVAGLASTKDAGATQILVNLGMVHKAGEVDRYWDGLLDDMQAAGWRLAGWYVWDQQVAISGRFGGRFAPEHEFVFHFNKVAREPNKCVPCLHAGLRKKRGKNSGTRKEDGTAKAWSGGESVTQPFKIPGSVVHAMRTRYSAGAIETQHPAVFPVEFAEQLIAPYSNKGEVVCDPFMGSGSTGVAAVKLGRKFIGIEIEQKYFDIAAKRISKAVAVDTSHAPKQAMLFATP